MGLCNKKMASRGGGSGGGGGKDKDKDKAKRVRGPPEAPAAAARPSKEAGGGGGAGGQSPKAAQAPVASAAAVAAQKAPPPVVVDAARPKSERGADQAVERTERASDDALRQLEESWSQKLQAVEQTRRAEEHAWSQKQISHERELAEVRRLLADADERLSKQRAEHEQEASELRAAAKQSAAAAATADIEPSRLPRLEDPDYPLFYEMIVYRKETVDQIEAPLEVGAPGDGGADEDDEVTVNGMRTLDVNGVSTSDAGGLDDNDDGRSRVTPCTSQPYQWIVSLLVRFPKDGLAASYRGTGCIVHLNDTGRVVILTSASNLFSRRLGGQATEVTIVPARDGVGAPYGTYQVSAADVRVAPEYVASEDASFNYAALFLDAGASEKSFGFGYATPGDVQLAGRLVQSAGYPSDKPDGTMWLCGGPVSQVHGSLFRFLGGGGGRRRSAHGSSGAPVWTWAQHNFVLVGLHGPAPARGGGGGGAASGGGTCLRFSASLLDRVKAWSAEYK